MLRQLVLELNTRGSTMQPRKLDLQVDLVAALDRLGLPVVCARLFALKSLAALLRDLGNFSPSFASPPPARLQLFYACPGLQRLLPNSIRASLPPFETH